jgi:hypothetical protein
VTEDWAAVSRAITDRMAELPLTQRRLIERSRVSKAIVGEIQHNTVQRHRSERTLVALSQALDWHPNHLDAILKGYPPPRIGDPVVASDKDVPSRLTVIENELRRITAQLERIDSTNHRLDDVASDIKADVARLVEKLNPPGR